MISVVNVKYLVLWVGSSFRLSFRFTVCGMTDVEADGVGSDKVAMASVRPKVRARFNVMESLKDMMWTRSQIDLGTYSDVRVKARLIFIIMV
ncbi:Intermediate Filament Family Orphan 1 [Manis pentadactyla]|nr:Intermediate Filament Family Orphan 1 [Manis pentadactyla]